MRQLTVVTANGRHGSGAMTSLVVVYVERGHVTVHSLVLVVANARLARRSYKSSTVVPVCKRVSSRLPTRAGRILVRIAFTASSDRCELLLYAYLDLT